MFIYFFQLDFYGFKVIHLFRYGNHVAVLPLRGMIQLRVRYHKRYHCPFLHLISRNIVNAGSVIYMTTNDRLNTIALIVLVY